MEILIIPVVPQMNKRLIRFGRCSILEGHFVPIVVLPAYIGFIELLLEIGTLLISGASGQRKNSCTYFAAMAKNF